MNAENLRMPALIATISAWAVVALATITALSLAVWLVSYSQMAESPTLLAITGIASVLSNIAYLLSVIAVLVWIYIANANLRRANLSGLNYSPAWATFSFFVPIANLFIPFKAMRELANRSKGEPQELNEAEVDEVFTWWGFWIGSMVVGLFVGYTVLVNQVPGLWVTTPFWATQALVVLSNSLTAGAAFFLIKVIRLVTQGQREGASQISAFD